MSEQTQVGQSTIVETISPELLAQLRKVSVLSSLKEQDLTCLKGVEYVHLAPGDFLTRQGEIGRYYWILLKGKARIFVTGANGGEETMHVYEDGAALGELSLLANVPNAASVQCIEPSELLRLDEHQFWSLMTSCPEVRKAVLGYMAFRLQKYQNTMVQQEKMASLGTLAAGLMHELNNPGAAARRAASQLKENLIRMHELSARFSRRTLTPEQKECIFDLQDHVLAAKAPVVMNSLDQSDAEEALAEWMESANIENAWKMAPTLVAIGINANELECARSEFSGELLSDALSWLEAMVSSMQLVNTIEESIGRVTDLVKAVKSYAYEGKGQRQAIDVNNSIYATLTILGHKIREKEVMLEKDFASDLPPLQSECTGLNQIWTNLLDNAIDAVPQHGRISIHTWAEKVATDPANPRTDLCISITDNGSCIPLDSQAQIFDPFYTTKPVGVGTGLGLGIVHRIVEQYGGVIHFSSQPGDTEFVVRIPAGQA